MFFFKFLFKPNNRILFLIYFIPYSPFGSQNGIRENRNDEIEKVYNTNVVPLFG